jgi:large subunit ribosomal protein L2
MHNFLINKVKRQLIVGFSKRAGRNFFGRKTIFTQGGGLRVKLRLIDFKRNIVGNNLLIKIEKDINRTAFVGLVCYENGLFSYILLSSFSYFPGKTLLNGFLNFNKLSSSTFLLNIPTGNIVHHIEMFPGGLGKISRSAGVSSFIISRDEKYTYLKMSSG